MSDPIRVLHVDDEAGFGDMTAQHLMQQDDRFDVTTETSARASLDLLEDGEDLDCIVSDYDMPEMDGIEFLDRVREEYPELPFVLFTGKGSEEVASDAISAGATDYLQKGVGTDQYAVLANRIANAVEKHQSQRALADRTSRLEALKTFNEELLENVPVGLFRVDDEFKVTYVNPRAQEIFGVPADADEPVSLGRDVRELPSVTSTGRSETLSRLSDGDRIEFEIPFVSMYGEESHLSVRGVPLTDDGAFDGAIIMLEDVTERKEQEQELRRQNDRLENVLGILSHDLRNPLNVAIGHIDLALKDRVDEDLLTANDALERMHAIIETTLTFARRGQAVTDEEPVDVRPFVEQCWDVVETSDADLEVVDDFEIRAVPDRLSHLFENLFRNAIVHGGEEVTIRVGTVENGYYVEDDGPGISEDEREAVLTAGHSTTDDGAGYGLTIVEQITEAHGWKIRVTDGIDGGARFEVTGVEIR